APVFKGAPPPPVRGWPPPDRIIVLEPMRGRTWAQLPADLQPEAMQRLGAALANVHGLNTDYGRGSFQRYRLSRVVNRADLGALARDDVAEDARRLGDRLAEEVPGRAPVVSLHGDVHTENVL